MSESPAWSAATLRSSLSTQMTWWPISAKQTAATRPTYPDPTTAILMFSLIALWCYSSQLRITEGRKNRADMEAIGALLKPLRRRVHLIILLKGTLGWTREQS